MTAVAPSDSAVTSFAGWLSISQCQDAMPRMEGVSPLLDVIGSLAPLLLASLLLLATAIDATRDRRRPLWMRLVVRIVVFAALTWLMQLAVGSPLAPQFRTVVPGDYVWAQLAEIGWWMVGARVAVGILRLVVVLENRPRETQIVSDLLAGAIYIATALAVINFVFGVPIAGLVATSGVVAIILGLALQSTLADVFSGIAVGLEHAYKPGDLLWVEGGIEGQVLQINWRSTQIATPQNSIAIVPNSVIAKSRLENRSAPTPIRSVTVTVSTDAAIDPRRCIAAIDAAVRACRLPLPQPKPSIGCVSLQGDGTAYEVRFVVGATAEIAAARTEMLSQVHRHLRHAGISLGVSGIAPLPSASAPTIAGLMAESDMLGSLTPDERALLGEHFSAITREPGETLICEGEMPEALFLLAAGTIELTRNENGGKRVLLRASPGDSVGMISLILGTASQVTATALTPVAAYSLDKACIAAVLRAHPELATSLEAQAKRGQAWLRCEAAAHENEQIEKPDMLLSRLRNFLQRLNA
jgi:small-conductance mechanosensitive channel/CRP-like cAMP-binding protein